MTDTIRHSGSTEAEHNRIQRIAADLPAIIERLESLCARMDKNTKNRPRTRQDLIFDLRGRIMELRSVEHGLRTIGLHSPHESEAYALIMADAEKSHRTESSGTLTGDLVTLCPSDPSD